MSALPAHLSRMDVAALLRRADGSDPADRLSATRELFRRGPAILPQLERAGAKPMRTVSPPRGDVIYTLLTGRLGAGRAAPDSFGLHVEANVTESEVRTMGRAHGFQPVAFGQCRPDLSPICYVQLTPGKRLASVLEEILTTEPRVSTVNLNYVAR